MKKQKIVFLFSGQGSQYMGMGKSLFENNTVFRISLEKSDEIVQEQLGRSFIDEMYALNAKNFDDVLITHPAIVAIEIAMYEVLKHLDIKADYVSGTSLGEFAAGVVSGIWDSKTAIEAAIKQAKSLFKNDTSGGMLAVLNQNKIVFEKDYKDYNLFLAGNNFEGHITVSGLEDNLDTYQLELSKHDIPFLRLPVNIPFHSPLILNGLTDFNHYMDMVTLNKPKPGFISGLKNKEMDVVDTNYFGKVVSKYTNYPKIVSHIENNGPCLYIDLGPSGTSSTFVKYNLDPSSKSKTFQIMTPFGRGLQQLEKLQEII